MKPNAIVSSLLALGALAAPSVVFGAAADLNACCTPGDKDLPKSGGNLGNQSYSSLNQITKSNINRLGPVWKTAVGVAPATKPTPGPGSTGTGQQTTPVIVDGVIYLDTENGGVAAVDGATGAIKWKWQPTLANSGFNPANTRRGVSVGDGKVYTLSGGNRVVALNKDSGDVVWAVQPTGPGGAALGNIAKVATIYHDGMVFVGTNDGNRNAAFAVKSSDGSMLWSFFGGAEPGRVVTDVNGVTTHAGDTWGPLQANGQSCAITGGVSPWLHGAVDPELGMFYVTFGNVRSCGSSQDGQQRPGDNLFANSLVALDMRTGAYKWHFQSVRHDIWDMDNVHSPVLANVQIGGQERKAIYYGSKTHYTFILDRTNGKSLNGAVDIKPVPVDTRQKNPSTQPFPPQGSWVNNCIAWEKLGTDNLPGNPWRGVPNYNGYQPDAQGNLVYTEPNYLDPDKPFVQYPAEYGANHRKGCLWDPHFDLPVLSMASQNGGADLSNHAFSPRTNLYYIPYGVAPVAHYRSAGSNGLRALGEYQTGGVFALNGSTGAVVWQNHLGLDAAHGAGVLATAGDVLFVGQPDGMVYGLDATSGKTLWKFQADNDIEATAGTYLINGEQHVLVLSEGDKLWAFKLGGSYKSASGSSEMPTPAPFTVRRPVAGPAVEGSTVNNTVYLARPNRTDVAASADSIATGGMSPTHMRVPVGTTVTFTNPGTAQMPAAPNTKLHCATQFFEGLFNPKLNPGESFQYTFAKEGEYFYNDCTDPRPTGKVVAYHIPQEVPGALEFVPRTVDMRPEDGVFTSVNGHITAMFDIPAGYTLDGNVKLKTPLSTTLFPATTAKTTGNGRKLMATWDKALIDNNVPAGNAVPLVMTANFMSAGVQKQLASTATVRIVK